MTCADTRHARRKIKINNAKSTKGTITIMKSGEPANQSSNPAHQFRGPVTSLASQESGHSSLSTARARDSASAEALALRGHATPSRHSHWQSSRRKVRCKIVSSALHASHSCIVYINPSGLLPKIPCIPQGKQTFVPFPFPYPSFTCAVYSLRSQVNAPGDISS